MAFLLLLFALIDAVEVKGTLRPVELETKPGMPYEQSMVRSDVRRLWSTGFFEDVQVEQPEPGRLVFRVVEKPRLRLRKVVVEPATGKLQSKPNLGTYIDAERAHQIAADLRKQLIAEGHPDPVVKPRIVRNEPGEADLVLNVEAGPLRRIGEVRFTGDLGLNEAQLRGALRQTRPRTKIPLIWKSKPGFSDAAVEGDLARVRSALLQASFLDAKVGPAETETTGDRAVVTIPIEAGRQRSTTYKMSDLCPCLLAQRRTAEQSGHIDFAARVSLSENDPVRVNLAMDKGVAYSVGRIEFRGNHAVTDSTLRRTMKFDEGALLDPRKLDQSIARLSRFSMFEPISEQDVLINRHPGSKTADIRITVRQRDRGRWALSGPALPLKIAGPLQAAVSSRLPAWGGGIFEASTYFASISLTGLTGPLSRALGLTTTKWIPLISLQRPLLPGQEWFSGFSLSPQYTWKYTALIYAGNQIQARIPGPAPESTPLVVPVERESQFGFLICEEKRSRWVKPLQTLPRIADLIMALR